MRGAALALAVVSLALPAHAALCAKPDLIDTFPPDGAVNVPPNATLTAHYESTAEYIDEEVILVQGTIDQDGGSVHGVSVTFNTKGGPEPTFDKNEGLLSITPPNELVPGEHYVIEWPKLRGINTASTGRDAKVSFTVGTQRDTEPPSFDGLTNINWDVRQARDACTGSFEERFVFNVTPGKASDDIATDLLALIVFQASGGEVGPTGAPKQVLTAPLPKQGRSVEVEQSIAAATGHVCFSAQVQDLTMGRSSGNGANKKVCVKTTAPPFFYGCRVAPLGRTPRGITPAALVLGPVVLSLYRRRRHRPTP
jgi:hypothetical protein